MPPVKVMVTGVYGLIGGAVYSRLRAAPDRYDVYGLARRRQVSDRVPEGSVPEIPEGRFFLSDLSNLDDVTSAVQGMEIVVHMAADPAGRSWDSVLASNVIGGYHVFEGCRRAGVKRVVFASTIQVSMGYRQTEPYRSIAERRYGDVPADYPIVTHEWPVRTLNLYSSSKVWGETLARTYSETHGMSCLCIRIGWVVAEDRPPRPEAADIWCSRRDIVELVECCVNAPESVRFDIFYGMSDNRWLWVDIAHAREVVGYVAKDRAEDRL
jgi:nucleoside-diphosphate-sugar epimerase